MYNGRTKTERLKEIVSLLDAAFSSETVAQKAFKKGCEILCAFSEEEFFDLRHSPEGKEFCRKWMFLVGK